MPKNDTWLSAHFGRDALMRNNLKTLRQSRGWTQKETAERMGTTWNQYVKLESGNRRLSDIWITRAAAAFSVDAGDIVSSREGAVPLVGHAGAGSLAHFFGDGQGPFENVSAPENATKDTVAIEIRGDSLGQMFNGWLGFYDNLRTPPTPDIVGKLCVIGLEDGRVLIKRVERGQLPNHYNLVSLDPPLYDVEILWAAPIKTLRPR